MPDIHLLQWSLAFAAAIWLTARWMLDRPGQRWRHIAAGVTSTLLWIPVAYTADNVHVADAGGTTAFGSGALAVFATFMVVVNLLGLIVGLLLWVEGEVEDVGGNLPDGMQRPGGRAPRESD